MTLDWIYWAISWILLTWHSAWAAIIPGGRALGNNLDWVLAIVFLVITVRVVLIPLFVRQIKSQREMQAIQPKIKTLQAKHKGDRATMQKELMELYKKEGVHPASGCLSILPMFLQIPVFLGLFHVLKRLNPNNSAKTLYGWSAEQFDSASMARFFGAPIAAKFRSNAAEVEALGASQWTVRIVVGLMVIALVATSYLSAKQMVKRTGWQEDPQQRMIQRMSVYLFPAFWLISGPIIPLGVIIYWVTNNLFSMGQQYWVLKKYPMPGQKAADDPEARAEAKARAESLAPAPGAKPKAVKGGAKAQSPAVSEDDDASPTAQTEEPTSATPTPRGTNKNASRKNSAKRKSR